MPRSWVLEIIGDEDDGEITREFDADGTWFPSGEPSYGNLLWCGAWAGEPAESYFRFMLPEAVPASVEIVNAALDLWGGSESGWDGSLAMVIRLEDAADATTVSGARDTPVVGGRSVRPTSVRWPASGGLAWSLGVANRTTDLGAQIAELVSFRGGLASGAHLQFWVWGETTSVAAQIGIDDFAVPGGHPAVLRLSACW